MWQLDEQEKDVTIFAVPSQKVLKLLKGHEDPSQVCLKKRDDRSIPGITLDVSLALFVELDRELHETFLDFHDLFYQFHTLPPFPFDDLFVPLAIHHA